MRRSGIIVLVTGLAFAGLVFYFLLGNEPVKVTGTRMENDRRGVDVAGRVENTGNRDEALTLEVHYYDQQGRPVGQDRITIERLKSGEARDFRSQKRDIAGAASFSIYLNHGRNPYGN